MAAAADKAAAVGRAASARQAAEAKAASAAAVDAATATTDDAEEEIPTEISAAERRRIKREAKAKRKAKAKAADQFRKQFGDDAGSGSGSGSGAGEGSPRAAVYKGEMGAKQRRATHMQEKANPGFSIKGIASGLSGFSLSELVKSRRFVICSAIAACVILGAIFMYTPVKNYYCNVREYDRLTLEYQAYTERNEQLQADVNSLSTDDGVKARAHDQLGWVEKGEESGTVKGLELNESSNANDVVNANVTSESVKAPRTWYSPALDFIFGYTKGE